MKHTFSVANLDEVREKLVPPYKPEGVVVALAHGPEIRFRVRDKNGDLYRGLVEDGRSAVLHRATGAFTITD